MHLPRHRFARSGFAILTVLAALLMTWSPAFAAIAIPVPPAPPYTQSFNGIGTTATAPLPADFRADRPATVRTVGTFAAAGTATTQVGGDQLGASASNGIYNFGDGPAATAADRAVGFLSSTGGSQSGNLYGQFQNTTGSALSGLTIAYDVEKYRFGTNAAGFRIQLYYSTDGSTWTDAGAAFLTAFPADAVTNGCADAPCATASVNQALNVAIPTGGTIYLAWNYSVASGSSPSSAQALAIDNISVIGTSGGGSTNPAVTGAANPASVVQGGQTLLTTTATPGSNPPSTNLSVTGNLSSIGGSATQQFFDNGTNGDVTAGDNVFSFQATVAAATSPGGKMLPITVTDGEGRSGSSSIALTVTAAVTTIPIGQVQGAVADGTDGTVHRSPFAPASGTGAGTQTVQVQGVVYQKTLALESDGDHLNGLFLQNTAATADSDPNTSDGIFVFMGGNTTIPRAAGGTYIPTIGDEIVLSGRVSEFFFLTQLSSGLVVQQVVQSGLSVDTAVPAFEANPPFNPSTGGSDLAEVNRYWERREGMRARVPAGSIAQGPQIVFASTKDAEIRVIHPSHPVAQRSDPYTRRTFRDPHPLDNLPDLFDDTNPYRILMGSIGVKGALNNADAYVTESARTFATLSADAIGGVYFSFSKYGVQPSAASFAAGVDPSDNHPPAAPNRQAELSVATFNVENLYDFRDDPNDGCDFIGNSGCPGVNPPFDYAPSGEAEYQTKLDALARQIIHDLKSPDVILTQEGEDQDICVVAGTALSCGSTNNADGKPDTLQDLALRVQQLGGPVYDLAFDRDGRDARGIITAFMYRTDRVQLPPTQASHPVLGSSPSVNYPGGLAYNADVSNPKALNAVLPPGTDTSTGVDGTNVYTRAPQVAMFRIYRTTVGVGAYEEIYLINNHFSSTPNARVGQRKEQAKYGAAIVAALQAAQPDTRVLYGGDLNVFPRPDDPFTPGNSNFNSDQLAALYNQGLFAIYDRVLSEAPRAAYSYVFDHQAQTLDQMFITTNLRNELIQARTAHINADWPTGYAADDQPERMRGVSDHDPSVARFTLAIAPDTTAPVTTTTTTPPAPNGQNGWFTKDVGVTLTAADEPDGSGVKEVVYSATGAQSIDRIIVPGATATFTITAEGTTTISYFARDNSNNAETPAKTLTIKLDKTAPTFGACTISPTSIWPPNGHWVPVTATVQGQDTGSGGVQVSLTGLTVVEGTVQTTTREWTLNSPDFQGDVLAARAGNVAGQEYRFTYTAKDAAGLTGTCSLTVTVPHDQGDKKP